MTNESTDDTTEKSIDTVEVNGTECVVIPEEKYDINDRLDELEKENEERNKRIDDLKEEVKEEVGEEVIEGYARYQILREVVASKTDLDEDTIDLLVDRRMDEEGEDR